MVLLKVRDLIAQIRSQPIKPFTPMTKFNIYLGILALDTEGGVEPRNHRLSSYLVLGKDYTIPGYLSILWALVSLRDTYIEIKERR